MNFANILPIDKLIHALVGIIIGFVVTMLFNPIAGLCAALAIGALKEWVYDAWMQKGNFEPWDLWATVGGGAIGSALGYWLPMIGKMA